MTQAPELVNITIDGKKIQVAKGLNVIEAAKSIGVEIPHYCYHPHLSIVGNCRMCKVEVVGAPKLEIGCNLGAREGLEIKTHHTSERVKETQAANLEFILINHPLDCTVCDQAGHCKLQDYHYEYNAKPSRFVEEKVEKVKAEPLGPTVMLDGERCIMCTRCIRFCDEVTGTSELGMLNRGDRSVIAVDPERPLNNPLSGSVVDLCPVGALTHKDWRFNTRVWFTKATDSICPGCSTGCNVKVHERDGKVVQVKARLNSNVNKEWLCDEGRYGFDRFLPEKRILSALINRDGAAVSEEKVSFDSALKVCEGFANQETIVFVSPDLTLEDFSALKVYLDKVVKRATVAVAYRERSLTPQEQVLVSPDYACNYMGALFTGLVSGDLEKQYELLLNKIRSGTVERVLFVGERAVFASDCDAAFLHGVAAATLSAGFLAEADTGLVSSLKIVLPSRTILEKSGMLLNRAGRLQYAERVVPFVESAHPEWRILSLLAARSRINLFSGPMNVEIMSDREITLEILKSEPRLAGITIKRLKAGGVDLRQSVPQSVDGHTQPSGAA
jgi:NADH-quinone oxidoreductase subunit G